jgi:hypothetical protein
MHLQVEQLQLDLDFGREVLLAQIREGRSLADLVRRAGGNVRLLREAFGCEDDGGLASW